MSHRDGIHADVHRLDGDAGVEIDHIFDLAHNGAADSGDIDAVFHDDVQLDGDGPVLVVIYFDSLAMDSRLSRWTRPSVLERTAMPFTP